jgi:hypothetical protein
MSDHPDGTAEEALSAEDLMDLLAPGSPDATGSPRGVATRGVVGRPAPGPSRAVGVSAASGAAAFGAMVPGAAAFGAPGSGAATFGVPGSGAAFGAPGSGAAAPVRVGSRFQPLPGPLPVASGPSIAAAAPSTPGLVLVAPAGTPVHAVEAGIVDRPEGAGHPLRVVADSGLTFCYGGVAPGSVTVSRGARVAAGTILGTVAVTSLSTAPPDRPRLVLRILDAAGVDVDVAAFLVGLPDPNELGHAAVGTGADIDPDPVDREIVLSAGSASPVRDGTP